MTGNCGVPDGVVHAHQNICYEAGRREGLAEIKRLRRWKAEATSLFDGLQDLGRALGLPLGALITGPAATAAAENLRNERDVAKAAIERTRGLADDWERSGLGTDRLCAADLRAALRGDR